MSSDNVPQLPRAPELASPQLAPEGFVRPEGVAGALRTFLERYTLLIDVLLAVSLAGLWLVLFAGRSGAIAVVIPLVILCGLLFVRRRTPILSAWATVVIPLVMELATVDFAGGKPGLVLGYQGGEHLPTQWLYPLAIFVYSIGRHSKYLYPRLLTAPIIVTAAVTAAVFSAAPHRVHHALTVLLLLALALQAGYMRRTTLYYIQGLETQRHLYAVERYQSAQLVASGERARIAREMHDIVAHSLSVVVRLSEGASRTIETDPALTKTAIDTITQTSREALRGARRLVGVLRTDTAPGQEQTGEGAPLEPQPSAQRIEKLISEFRAAGLPIRYQNDFQVIPGDHTVQIACYRIVQESLTNIIRHAPTTTSVQVRLCEEPRGWLNITVFNSTGPGLGPIPSGNKGLIGIRERAAAHEGTSTIGPFGDGWRVLVTLKIKE